MTKTRNPKNPDHRYFDVQKIGELNELSVAAGLQEYVSHYAEYVVFRAKAFTGRYWVVFCFIVDILLADATDVMEFIVSFCNDR